MSFDKTHPLISPNQLINSIDSFALSVTNYLSPVIRFVGHKDRYFDYLYRNFPDLHHEKRFSNKLANLVIFDDFPAMCMTEVASLPVNSAYIFCLDEPIILTDEHRQLLKKRVSITLYKPTPESLFWHAKALLMLQDVSFYNTLYTYPSLISVDVEFRRSLADLVLASLNLSSCLVFIETEDILRSVEKFLFESLPSSALPFKATIDGIDKNDLPDTTCSLVMAECHSISDVEDVLTLLEPCAFSKPLIALIACGSLVHESIPTASKVVRLTDMRDRVVDLQLVAFWCSSYLSSTYELPKYYSSSQLQKALDESCCSTDSIVELLLNDPPTLDQPSDEFVKLISRYNRPSIDDILNDAEQRIMVNLESRAGIKDAASSAAGIPTVTFRKRLRRLGEKESLIRLISSSDNET